MTIHRDLASKWLVLPILALVGAMVMSSTLPAAASTPTGDACTPPDSFTGDAYETAWQIMVAALCPVNQHRYPYVVWENWIEQSDLFPEDPTKGLVVPNSGGINPPHPLHGSPLTFLRHHLPGSPDDNCNKASLPPPNDPNRVICEEVRDNGAAEDYIAGRGFWQRSGQQEVAERGGLIQFPKPAVEIKADWVVLHSCASLPTGVHVEKLGTTCYALAGIHLISKLISKWIWSTFEPQNLSTNPDRCVVLGCQDQFGSVPPVSKGGPGGNTKLSAKLSALMTQANLDSIWRNYRLDGVQTTFLTSSGKPWLLGNSIIEGENAGVPLTQSSCITCHDVSSIKNDGTDGITLLTSNPVGNPAPLPSPAWIRRDFVWTLGLACPGSLMQDCD